MRRLWAMIAVLGLGTVLLVSASSDALAWRGGWRGGGWHGGGWHGGWGGVGWRGGGWRGAGWNGGWGWNRGWGWPAAAGLGLGWAATSPYWGSGWGGGYGWPYSSYSYGWPYSTYSYGWPYDNYYGSSYARGSWGTPTYRGAYQARPAYSYAQTAPLVTGRSVAAGNIGMHCATSVKTCLLRNASYVGVGCSCRVTAGRARGAVVP